MPVHVYSLLAVLPFNGIEKKLLALQRRLFRQTGFASALALPPVIPLCWLPEGLNVNAVREVLKQHKPAGTFSMAGLKQQAGVVILKTRSTWQSQVPGNLQQWILDTLRPGITEAVPAAKPLFAVVDGFYLAVNETNLLPVDYSTPDTILVSKKFSTYQIVLLQIQVYTNLPVWWQNVTWEIPVCVKVRSG